MKYLLVFLLFIGLSSCNKRDTSTFTLKGSITNYNTGLAEGNVKVDIYEVTNSGINSGPVLLSTTYSNPDGSYEVKFSRNLVESYNIVFQKEGFFSEIISKPFGEFTTAEDNILDLSYRPVGWILFDIENIGATVAQDQLKIYKESGEEICPDCCANGFYYFDGPNVDTIWTCASIADQWFVFHYWDIEGNFYKKDSVLINQNDTTVYTINY